MFARRHASQSLALANWTVGAGRATMTAAHCGPAQVQRPEHEALLGPPVGPPSAPQAPPARPRGGRRRARRVLLRHRRSVHWDHAESSLARTLYGRSSSVDARRAKRPTIGARPLFPCQPSGPQGPVRSKPVDLERGDLRSMAAVLPRRRRRSGCAFISHTHGDHLARHDRTIATPSGAAGAPQGLTRAPEYGCHRVTVEWS